MGFVFISHASSDKPGIVESGVLHALLEEGIPIWIDKPSKLPPELANHRLVEGIPPDTRWLPEIHGKTEEAACILAFWSNTFVERMEDPDGAGKHISEEVEAGFGPPHKLLNVKLETLTEANKKLREAQMRSFQRRNQKGQTRAGRKGNARQDSDLTNPGGRERAIKDLIKAVRKHLREHEIRYKIPDRHRDPLLYMLDRNDQATRLSTIEFKRGAVVVTVGQTHDRFDLFAERVANVSFARNRRSRTLTEEDDDPPSRLKALIDGTASSDWCLQPIGAETNSAQSPEELLESTLRGVCDQITAYCPPDTTDRASVREILSNEFRRVKRPTLWTVEYSLNARSLSTIIKTCSWLSELWSQLPLSAGVVLIHVNSGTDFQSLMQGGKARIRRRLRQEGLFVLPEFTEIEVGDLAEWVSEVAKFMDLSKQTVRKSVESTLANKPMPMKSVVDAIDDSVIDTLWARRTPR